MKAEAKELVSKYGRPRRTIIAAPEVAETVSPRELINDEKGLIILSTNGYIKRVLDSSFTTQV
jgi:DNA gyrase/topoisomerase IV subunit A